MKKGFIKGEAIRYARLSSKYEDFKLLIELFIQRLRKRGYPLSFILKQIQKVDWKDRKNYLTYKVKNKGIIPLVFQTKFNPVITHIYLRKALNHFSESLQKWELANEKLTEKVTISYSLPNKLHKKVLRSRAHKGF